MKKIRWGIVGPGIIANRFAEATKNVNCAELVAVASREKDRGESFAKKHGINNVFCGYEQMANSSLIDAVYISTPHPFHMPCAELFLKAGKHVLCEKPLCVNAYEAQKLKQCAKENGVFLMEAMWTRFLPAIIEAKKIVDRGDIGEIMGIEADFCYNFPFDPNHRIYRNNMAGGSLLDVGVYGLHFASAFLGNSPELVTATADIKHDVDIHTTIMLKYKNGAIANVSSAIGLLKPETGFIYGTNGYIRIPCFYYTKELFVNTRKGEKNIIKNYMGNGFEEEIIECCRCIEQGKTESEILPLDESIAIMKQMDQVRTQIGLKYPSDNFSVN